MSENFDDGFLFPAGFIFPNSVKTMSTAVNDIPRPTAIADLKALEFVGSQRPSVPPPPMYPKVPHRPSSLDPPKQAEPPKPSSKSNDADRYRTDPFQTGLDAFWMVRPEDTIIAAEAERYLRHSRRPFGSAIRHIDDGNLLDVSVVARPSRMFVLRAVYRCNITAVNVRLALERRGIDFGSNWTTNITVDDDAGKTYAEVFVYLRRWQLKRLYQQFIDRCLAWTAVGSLVLLATSAVVDLPKIQVSTTAVFDLPKFAMQAGVVGIGSSVAALVLRSA